LPDLVFASQSPYSGRQTVATAGTFIEEIVINSLRACRVWQLIELIKETRLGVEQEIIDSY
jgi:hypothetical protein